MTDKENILLEEFFKQAAEQQIEDNGFTERVMQSLPDGNVDRVRVLSRLWTLFCVVVAAVLFFALGGWQMLTSLFYGGLAMLMGWLGVLVNTAPTTEIPVNPVVILMAVAFVGVYLPYRTYRKLSAAL